MQYNLDKGRKGGAVMLSFAGTTALYSVSHFAVDFTCAFYIFSSLQKGGDGLLCLLIYNFCAFALQMPLGLLADRANNNRTFALAGMLLVASGLFFGELPLLLCAVLGLGNALFHIGGGRDVLCGNGGKFTALGIFVSPGAIGLFFGTMLGRGAGLPPYLPSVALLLLLLAVLLLAPKSTEQKEADMQKAPIKPLLLFSALACLFIVVCIRSLVGVTLSFPWKPEPYMAAALVLALALGKASGGFLADRFGAKRTAVITLALSALLFVFYDTPVCGLLAVFLFNMTMPISLGAVIRLMPASPGFGFGLLTFGLFLGALPVLLGLPLSMAMPIFACAACVVSALLLFVGIRGDQNGQ